MNLSKRNNYSLLDLFSGMGGISYGFSKNGFNVTGVEINKTASKEYTHLTGGININASVTGYNFNKNYDVIAGGPPCKPWSPVNLHKRGPVHRDYNLVSEFFSVILDRKPLIFIMENVPVIRNDPVIKEGIKVLRSAGYCVKSQIIKYSDYGAPTSRSRFFITGTLNMENHIFDNLEKYKKSAHSVKDAIWEFRNLTENRNSDHVWPHLKTIYKYSEKYRTGKFGWRILKWEDPAPSFGNVMKTYTLHPDSDPESRTARTISVLEAMNIMGFTNFHFSPGLGIAIRYQMVVDSVSPVFSDVLARVIKQILMERADEISVRY